jgi:hypothetical protein
MKIKSLCVFGSFLVATLGFSLDKNYGVGLTLGDSGATRGVEVYQLRGERDHFGLRVGQITHDLKPDVMKVVLDRTDVEKATYSVQNLSVHKRHFFESSSGNYRLGAGYRQHKVKLSASDYINSSENYGFDLSASAASIELAIGNRWSWDSGVTFGVDWIGLNIPVYSKIDFAPKGVTTDQEKRDKERLEVFGKNLLTVTSLVALNVFVGYEF